MGISHTIFPTVWKVPKFGTYIIMLCCYLSLSENWHSSHRPISYLPHNVVDRNSRNIINPNVPNAIYIEHQQYFFSLFTYLEYYIDLWAYRISSNYKATHFVKKVLHFQIQTLCT